MAFEGAKRDSFFERALHSSDKPNDGDNDNNSNYNNSGDNNSSNNNSGNNGDDNDVNKDT